MRVYRVYFRGGFCGFYTDQVAAGAATARLYAARLFPKFGTPIKTECMTLRVNGVRTHVDPKLDRSFLLLSVPTGSGGDCLADDSEAELSLVADDQQYEMPACCPKCLFASSDCVCEHDDECPACGTTLSTARAPWNGKDAAKSELHSSWRKGYDR